MRAIFSFLLRVLYSLFLGRRTSGYLNGLTVRYLWMCKYVCVRWHYFWCVYPALACSAVEKLVVLQTKRNETKRKTRDEAKRNKTTRCEAGPAKATARECFSFSLSLSLSVPLWRLKSGVCVYVSKRARCARPARLAVRVRAGRAPGPVFCVFFARPPAPLHLLLLLFIPHPPIYPAPPQQKKKKYSIY